MNCWICGQPLAFRGAPCKSCNKQQYLEMRRAELVSAAAEAQELFGDDELEMFAQSLRKRA